MKLNLYNYNFIKSSLQIKLLFCGIVTFLNMMGLCNRKSDICLLDHMCAYMSFHKLNKFQLLSRIGVGMSFRKSCILHLTITICYNYVHILFHKYYIFHPHMRTFIITNTTSSCRRIILMLTFITTSTTSTIHPRSPI